MTHSTALTLARCPFCGTQPESIDIGFDAVTCPSCAINGPTYPNKVEAWNRRAELAASADAGPRLWQDERADLRRQLAKAKAANHGYRLQLHQAHDQLAALARPAPATTAPVSAQGDERAAFEAWAKSELCNPGSPEWNHGVRMHWAREAWNARAQVAQGDEVDARAGASQGGTVAEDEAFQAWALKADAMRYRWLRSRKTWASSESPTEGTTLILHFDTYATLPEGDDAAAWFDGIVDAARAQQGGQT
jgi:hypothetical protein